MRMLFCSVFGRIGRLLAAELKLLQSGIVFTQKSLQIDHCASRNPLSQPNNQPTGEHIWSDLSTLRRSINQAVAVLL